MLWALFGVALAGSAAHADEDEGEPLGTAGQWLLGGSGGGSYQLTHTEAPTNARLLFTNITHWSGWLAPSAQLFIARDIALGGAVCVGSDYYARDDFDLSEWSASASPQISFHVALGEHTFLLPELSLGIAYVARSLTFSKIEGEFDRYRFIPNRAYYAALGSDLGVLQTTLFMPFAYTPAPGIFFGLGPYVRGRWAWTGVLDPSGRKWAVAIGAASIIGTWF